jgi:hypothetical protein
MAMTLNGMSWAGHVADLDNRKTWWNKPILRVNEDNIIIDLKELEY